ncbi:hypothetical protein SODALDRAFT_321998 [Sodiomyces alkalinus F11]|uniref:Uncharacterized protein n=1 Tax=Sodiomyces alkalinus (strain CBS 110278 / VKM F-3762 / F11) TaxID=1314773 RepID=A0A3N2Q1R5_SODAK|nr:hypothetical protein SODALDRAFT_321998 [Sodiomyces alkalinus F11]ROT40699.1 hypothetical protein SODALDRAFT_321998 [Sodiomyces alkalinus F11]
MPPFNARLRRDLSSDILDRLLLPLRAPPADLPAPAPQFPTPSQPRQITPVVPRQESETTLIIPTTYTNIGDLAPGAVAGIVLGSVFGFLLLVWLVYMCTSGIAPAVETRTDDSSLPPPPPPHRSRRSRHQHHHHHHHPPSHRRSGGRARVIATETTRVRSSGGRGPGPIIVDAPEPEMSERARSVSRPPPRVVESDEDEVVVIEENTPPRRNRRQSRHSRHSSYDDH